MEKLMSLNEIDERVKALQEEIGFLKEFTTIGGEYIDGVPTQELMHAMEKMRTTRIHERDMLVCARAEFMKVAQVKVEF